MVSASIVEKIAISQFPSAALITDAAILTGLVSGKNANMTAGQIANLVTKQRLNLGKVQDLAPNELPVSDATQAALDKKMDKNGVVPIDQVDGLQAALDTKLDKTESIPITQVTGLEARLDAVEHGMIPVDRIDGFAAGVDAVIDARTDLKPQVVKGAMDW